VSQQGRGSYIRPFLVLFALGLLGVAALYPTLEPIARQVQQRVPEMSQRPLAIVQLLLLINPTLFLVIGVAIGTALAPRLGLRSHLAAWARGERAAGSPLRAELPIAATLGALAAVVILVLDPVAMPLLGDAGRALRALNEAQPRTLAVTLAGMLYGGITEELLMRWCLMSLLAWLMWRVAQRGRERPSAGIFWVALVVTAVAFGAGHLGAAGAQLTLTPALVSWIIVANALAGLIFGWLLWKRSLEAAMIAHATGHVVFTLAAWSGLG